MDSENCALTKKLINLIVKDVKEINEENGNKIKTNELIF